MRKRNRKYPYLLEYRYNHESATPHELSVIIVRSYIITIPKQIRGVSESVIVFQVLVPCIKQ